MRNDTGKVVKWVVLGCLGAFLLVGGLVASCLVILMTATKPAVEASEAFLTAMGNGDWAAAKGKADVAVGLSLEGAAKSNPAVWGKSWSVNGRSINSSNGVTTAEITTSLTGTDGQARTVVLRLLDSGGWKVTAVLVNGAQLMPVPMETVAGTGLRVSEPKVEKKEAAEGKGWVVVVSAQVHGLKQEGSGEQAKIRFRYGIVVTAPSGEEAMRVPEFRKYDGVGQFGTLSFDVTIPKDAAAGTYKVGIMVTDDVSGDETTKMVRVDIP